MTFAKNAASACCGPAPDNVALIVDQITEMIENPCCGLAQPLAGLIEVESCCSEKFIDAFWRRIQICKTEILHGVLGFTDFRRPRRDFPHLGRGDRHSKDIK